MNDGSFEWDDDKASTNYAKHGVSFEMVRGVFRDPFAIEQLDEREDYGEERFTLIGMAAGGRLLFVAYTMRGDTFRIISARGAEPYEQRQYFDESA
jgi:uncharacterized DUF497 family protein